MLEQHLRRLIEELEWSEMPAKNEADTYAFKLNPELQIDLKQLDPGVSFYTILAPLPTVKKEELFIYLMKANFLGRGTGESAIALDPDEKFLTLSLVLPYDMNYKIFKEALEDFANYTEYWKEELAAHQKAAGSTLI